MLDVFLIEGQLVWNIPLMAGLFCMGVLYVALLRTHSELKVHPTQPLLFFSSLFLLYLTIGSPLSTLNHLLFSLHMIQMSILFFVIPPLFLLGIPETHTPIIKGISLSPFAALVTFAIMFFFYHLQAVLTFLTLNPFIHNSYLFLLLLLSFMIWRPIVREQNKQYAFLSGILLLPACGQLILSGLFGSATNPLLSEMMASLCITPAGLNSLGIFPSAFNSRIDLIIAGILMMGMHKFALLLTARLKNKVIEHDLTGNG
ncbi:cytochrome c oxidase assembly protein [Bacillus sp. AFS076308]|uniref:cytochrome c oxidase assembly protein n=1 Tax=Bacillus sp. AFS076308 TaxID=2033512 RepID=UPI001596B525|nr:cytochrome c oxidase assembly protein [Bacillus sp. AFS076308]